MSGNEPAVETLGSLPSLRIASAGSFTGAPEMSPRAIETPRELKGLTGTSEELKNALKMRNYRSEGRLPPSMSSKSTPRPNDHVTPRPPLTPGKIVLDGAEVTGAHLGVGALARAWGSTSTPDRLSPQARGGTPLASRSTEATPLAAGTSPSSQSQAAGSPEGIGEGRQASASSVCSGDRDLAEVSGEGTEEETEESPKASPADVEESRADPLLDEEKCRDSSSSVTSPQPATKPAESGCTPTTRAGTPSLHFSISNNDSPRCETLPVSHRSAGSGTPPSSARKLLNTLGLAQEEISPADTEDIVDKESEVQYEWQFEILNSLPRNKALALMDHLKESERDRAKAAAKVLRLHKANDALERRLEAATTPRAEGEDAQGLQSRGQIADAAHMVSSRCRRSPLQIFVPSAVILAVAFACSNFAPSGGGPAVVREMVTDSGATAADAIATASAVIHEEEGHLAWDFVGNVGSYTDGALVVDGYNHRVDTLAECKLLCKNTPECKYLHWCTQGSQPDRRGECWGWTSNATHVQASGCSRVANYKKIETWPASTSVITSGGSDKLDDAVAVVAGNDRRTKAVVQNELREARERLQQCRTSLQQDGLVRETTVREMTLRETKTLEYNPAVIEQMRTEHGEMRMQLERLWFDIDDAVAKGQDTVCWKL